jgi:hypothetical protein
VVRRARAGHEKAEDAASLVSPRIHEESGLRCATSVGGCMQQPGPLLGRPTPWLLINPDYTQNLSTLAQKRARPLLCKYVNVVGIAKTYGGEGGIRLPPFLASRGDSYS